MKKEWPIATIALCVVLVAFYFVISGGSTYVAPLSRLYPLGISLYNPVGAFTYSFVHIGFKHLIGNLVALAALGIVLERIVDKSKVLGVFITSGVLGGLAYVLINPTVWVVGASTAIAGVLAAAIIADTKKGLIVFALVMLLVPNMVLPGVDDMLDSMENKKLVDAAQAKINLMELEEIIGSGNYTNETIAQQQLLEEQYLADVESRQTLSEGRSNEATTPASLQIHVLGGGFAVAFLWLVDRKLLKDFWRRFTDFIKS